MPSKFQKSRRVAATMFRWMLPTRPRRLVMATDGKVDPPGRSPKGLSVSCTTANSGGPPLPTDNRGSYDIATPAIFPEYVEFDAAEVLQFVVPVPAGKTPA